MRRGGDKSYMIIYDEFRSVLVISTVCFIYLMNSIIFHDKKSGAMVPKARSAVPLSVKVWSHKSEYRCGEPIRLGIRILNVSNQEVRLDYRIVFPAHVRVIIKDSKGNLVKYPGWDIRVRLAPLSKPEEFIKLCPGYFIGVEDFTKDFPRIRIVIQRKGVYTIYTTYSSWESGKELGISAWTGSIAAPPIKVRIK